MQHCLCAAESRSWTSHSQRTEPGDPSSTYPAIKSDTFWRLSQCISHGGCFKVPRIEAVCGFSRTIACFGALWRPSPGLRIGRLAVTSSSSLNGIRKICVESGSRKGLSSNRQFGGNLIGNAFSYPICAVMRILI